MSKLKLGVIIVLIGAIVAGAVTFIIQIRSNPPIYLGVMVPETARETTTKRAVTSIQMYLDMINKQGGVNGHPLKLIVIDDGATTDTAIQAMDKVAKENKAMIILGHAYSDLAIAIGPSLQQYKIPAIAAGATAPEVTADNDWFFRVVPNNTG